MIRAIMKFLFKIFAIIMYRPKIVGKENIPEGGALLCPNHVHNLDCAVIIAMNKRKINVLAKEELFKSKFFVWLGKKFGLYPVKRGKADLQAIKISLKILKHEELLLIFPEGTRNGLAKGVKPRSGAVLIAATANKPIIPIGIQGNFKPFKKVVINIGKPIKYSEYEDGIKDKEIASDLTCELMNEIIRLRDEKIVKKEKSVMVNGE